MSNYRRWRESRVYFFTVVTAKRQRILTSALARQTLRRAIHEVRRDLPFHMLAVVLLPDHLHTVWELPREDSDYSTRWKRIKTEFTISWLDSGGAAVPLSASQRKRGEKGVWQRRFFEHTVRDEADLKRCIDYVHVNPLKHRLVDRVVDWEWSSFHRHVRLGEYTEDWGSANNWYGDEFQYFE